MARVKVPKTARVGGITYKINYPWVFAEDPQLVGFHSGDLAEIHIADLFQSKLRTVDRIYETLMHELMHAIDFIWCNHSFDEQTVELVSPFCIK